MAVNHQRKTVKIFHTPTFPLQPIAETAHPNPHPPLRTIPLPPLRFPLYSQLTYKGQHNSAEIIIKN